MHQFRLEFGHDRPKKYAKFGFQNSKFNDKISWKFILYVTINKSQVDLKKKRFMSMFVRFMHLIHLKIGKHLVSAL